MVAGTVIIKWAVIYLVYNLIFHFHYIVNWFSLTGNNNAKSYDNICKLKKKKSIFNKYSALLN